MSGGTFESLQALPESCRIPRNPSSKDSHQHLSIIEKFKHPPAPTGGRATPLTSKAMAQRSQVTTPKSHSKLAASPVAAL